MKRQSCLHAVAAILAFAAVSAPAFASGLGERDRAALHAAMVQHIDRQTIDGLYLKMNVGEGRVTAYSPAKSHPMVLEMGEHYVMCTDFRDEAGKSVPVDFYVARRGKDFTIFETVIGNRGPLEKLVQAGKAKPVQ